MHTSFLPYLVDPHTGEALEVAIVKQDGDIIIEGTLSSKAHTYPIVRGIPRFAGYHADDNYADSFGYEWHRWNRIQFESENKGRAMEGHTLTMWEKITAIKKNDSAGAVVGDFGCGSGRFVEVARMKGLTVIGMDLSDAVEVAGENFRHDQSVLIVQGDIAMPPVKSESLDGAFSIGVLHHTDHPMKSFFAMVSTVRAGGWIAISVYGKGGYYDFPTVLFYRWVFRALMPVFGYYPPLLYSYVVVTLLRPLRKYIPLIGKALKVIFPFVYLPDYRWAVLDTFDSVTPSYQSAHESYEVFQWFKAAGLTDIEPSDWGFTSFHAKKSKQKEDTV